MKAIRWIIDLYLGHGTKILGFLTIVVAGLPEIDGLVAPEHLPYWKAANVVLGALTIQRGMQNSRAVAAVTGEPPIAPESFR